MMKIKTDDACYYFPYYQGLNILMDNEFSSEIICCLNSYFGSKKKNYCSIYDENLDLITPKDFDFIYISRSENIDSNLSLKEKSILGTYIKKYIDSYPEDFTSLDRIRKDIELLISDRGMFRLIRLLKKDIDINYEIDLDNFNIAYMMEMLKILVSEYKENYIYASLYNVLLSNKNINKCIVYIDFEIDDVLLKWAEKIGNNCMVVVNSKSLDMINDISVCRAIICNNGNLRNEVELSKKEISRFIYMMNPYVCNRICFQKEENIKFLENFVDKNTDYLVKFI